ncbi:hypothetical protein SAMN04488042_101992 [Shimia aestuarii]|uniref:Uncharacterized protein n=1 Tax=Shimia aestuarii TaxID=254406 RepID=A0A1I4JFE2_9RHOB|nr:hypothetical protein SAMN04488042_101992 [Shimia aestuarii]
MEFWLRNIKAVICACLVSVLLAQTALARCGLPDDVMHLWEQLETASAISGADQAAWAHRLSNASGRVDMGAVSKKLFSVGMPNSRTQVDVLLREAQRFGGDRDWFDRKQLRRQLDLVEQLDILVCKLETSDGRSGDRTEPEKVGKSNAQMPLPRQLLDSEGMLRMGVLLGVVALMILLIFAIRVAFDWAYAVTHNRRSCRIQAVVESGLDVIDGHITILGRKGCRFQPVNEGAYARLEQTAQARYVTLYVSDHAFPMLIDGTYGHFAALYFNVPLSREGQGTLLGYSSMTPRYVPRSKTTARTRKSKQADRAHSPHGSRASG